MAPMNGSTRADIIDIRQYGLEQSILAEIREGLNPADGQEKRLPTSLLYDQPGLELFQDITYLDEYYLTNTEIDVLEQHAREIAKKVPANSQVIELGSGNLRKVNILLKAFEKAGKDIDYYALDLCRPELERTLTAVHGLYDHVHCHGLFGTYEDGFDWLIKANNVQRPKVILWLGSSIGNFPRPDAAQFLKKFSRVLQAQDSMLIGIDACQDSQRVFNAYNDKAGTTHKFDWNGLSHANKLFGTEVFNREDWTVISEYDKEVNRHQVFYAPNKDVFIEGTFIKAGERIRIEESNKYSLADSDVLWKQAGLVSQTRFGNRSNNYHLHMVASTATFHQ